MRRHAGIIIPVYNEERSIVATLDRVRRVVEKIPDFTFEIICVNDGSKDKTMDLLKQQGGIRVLNHRVNRGYGAALRTGLEACEAEWIFIVDADGTYPLEDLSRLVDELDEDTDMVVGARQGVGISHNPLRQFARWVLRKMVHVLTGVMVPDLNSGMRLFRKSLYINYKHLLPMGFSFTSTITVASLYSGYGVKYIPIQYEKRVGHSNIRPLADFIGFTMLIVRLASYFDPLRFFIPLSLLFLVGSFLRGVRDVIVTNAIGNLSLSLFILSVQIFMLGVIADVIVRRSALSQKQGK